MSVVVIDNQMVHYEAIGRGAPVVFLHGWLGSWRYWFPSMEKVSSHFRCYSFDFWGFGDSRNGHTIESVQAYSNQVIRFLDKLGIERAQLVGHSMGGMVALKTAINNRKRIVRVAAVGAPIVGSSLSALLKLTDYPVIARLFANTEWFRRFMFRRFLAVEDDPGVREILDDSVKSSSTTINRAISSMLRTDLRPELSRLSVPSLIIHGGRDEIVHPNQADLFANVDNAQVVLMPECHHFPFLEDAELFNDVLLRFLRQENQRPFPQHPPLTQPATVM